MATPELFVRGLTAPGGIAFDTDENLFVAETRNGRIQKISPDGKRSLFASPGGTPAGIAIDDSSDMFVADSRRRHLLLISPDEAIDIYAHQCRGKRFIGPQDLYFSPAGNIVFTDAGDSSLDNPCGGIYSVDLDGEVKQLAEGLAGPAGLVISEDGASLYVAEAGAKRILCCSIGDNEVLEDQQVFLQLDEDTTPGSLLFDAGGMLYVGCTGAGLTLVDPDGQIVERIPLPGHEPAGMTFGGPNFDELGVAEVQTGAVYRLPTEHPGQRPFVGPRSI